MQILNEARRVIRLDTASTAVCFPEGGTLHRDLEMRRHREHQFLLETGDEAEWEAADDEDATRIFQHHLEQLAEPGRSEHRRVQTNRNQLRAAAHAAHMREGYELLREGYLPRIVRARCNLAAKDIRLLQMRLLKGLPPDALRKGRARAIPQCVLRQIARQVDQEGFVESTVTQLAREAELRWPRLKGSIKPSTLRAAMLRDLNLSLQKKRTAKPGALAPQRPAERAEYARRLAVPLAEDWEVIYVDESGFNFQSDVPRVWRRRGDRSFPRVEGNKRSRNFTVIGALSRRGVEAFMVVEEWIRQDSFAAFMGCLAARLGRQGRLERCAFVLDNLAAHKTHFVYKAALGRVVALYLPPYSPQLNPIELLWGWLKRRWQRHEAREPDDLPRFLMRASQELPESCVRGFHRETARHLLAALAAQAKPLIPHLSVRLRR